MPDPVERFRQKSKQAEQYGYEGYAIAFGEAADTISSDREKLRRLQAVAKGMEPGKFESLAHWMDLTDRLLDLWEKAFPDRAAEMEEARGKAPRDTIQRDLRGWAAALAALLPEDLVDGD